jgi:hypothetical protein
LETEFDVLHCTMKRQQLPESQSRIMRPAGARIGFSTRREMAMKRLQHDRLQCRRFRRHSFMKASDREAIFG